MGYEDSLICIEETDDYASWIAHLRDRRARRRIQIRIERLRLGNPGDVAAVGEGVSELRIDYGPGYRVYYVQRGCHVVVLLAGGDKSTQQKDIRLALALARRL
jgi:putative addiction module killer protein